MVYIAFPVKGQEKPIITDNNEENEKKNYINNPTYYGSISECNDCVKHHTFSISRSYLEALSYQYNY